MLQGEIDSECAAGESASPQHRTEVEPLSLQHLQLSVVCVVNLILGSSNSTKMESSPDALFLFSVSKKFTVAGAV